MGRGCWTRLVEIPFRWPPAGECWPLGRASAARRCIGRETAADCGKYVWRHLCRSLERADGCSTVGSHEESDVPGLCATDGPTKCALQLFACISRRAYSVSAPSVYRGVKRYAR